MRRFVVIGARATASADFLLGDIPGTSGRIDVLLRCLRASLLVSHGVRRDTLVYLVLLGGARAPCTLRVEGATARFLRPDERSLAVLVQKSLAARTGSRHFVTVRPGVSVADAGFDAVLADVPSGDFYLLDEAGDDIRDAPLDPRDATFVLGDHLGLDDQARAQLSSLGARTLRVGPVSVHADDAIAVVTNELDRRAEPR
jgi:tRNA (pseudouridine54-N1)-methyltransferase